MIGSFIGAGYVQGERAAEQPFSAAASMFVEPRPAPVDSRERAQHGAAQHGAARAVAKRSAAAARELRRDRPDGNLA